MNPQSSKLGKVGIIAGGGDLPLRLAKACEASGQSYLILGLEGWAGEEIKAYQHQWISLGKVGATFKALKRASCESVVIAGYVKRPDFSNLKLDREGVKLLPKVIRAAHKGDDALLSTLVDAFEKNGFTVRGAETIFADLLSEEGVMGEIRPSDRASTDILKAIDIIKTLSPLDVGQGAVVCNNLVLAIEALEGTDEMLKRCAALPKEIRGTPEKPKGVLVKMPKIGQEKRIDLPTIGLQTIALAHAANLEGIAVAAGGSLILDREQVIEAANRTGLFILGISEDRLEI